jgi:hypothetical protein
MMKFAAMFLAVTLTASVAVTDIHAQPAPTSSRPSIWVTDAERPAILKKIDENKWARDLYTALKTRTDEAAPSTVAERRARIQGMPLVPSNKPGSRLILMTFTQDPGGPSVKGTKWGFAAEESTRTLKGLQDAVDCGVLYYLTDNEKYAICAADMLHLFVSTFKTLSTPKESDWNAGWLYTDHLLEARIVGAQVPIVYDLIYDYLAKGGQVYDASSNKLQSFNMDDAQFVFRTYADLALNRGLYDSNWPVLESPSLIHNILALEDTQERAKLLGHVLENDTKRQPSLKTLNTKFTAPGDIWPESVSYSKHVSGLMIYVLTLLDRTNPNLDLGKKYPNILGSYDTFYDIQFPNGEYPAFGDSNRRMATDYMTYEIALNLMQMNDNSAAEQKIKNILSSSISGKHYDRSALPRRTYGAAPYFDPLKLLWSTPDLTGAQSVDLAPPRPQTLYLSHAGVAVQRNEHTRMRERDGLMAVLGGGAYIHGHASGIDLELYGRGSVLGVESGKSGYATDIHENYYRLFAGHNTVISNGASAAKGGWVNLATDIAKVAAVEPALRAEPVSKKYSFTTMQFRDQFNLVAPADHERTVAIVRLNDTHGYYLDVFKAKSDNADQFHDYLYRNIADTFSMASNGKDLSFAPDPQRYVDKFNQVWSRNKSFIHPGWRFFEDVQSTSVTDAPVTAEFVANGLGDGPVRMRALIPGGLPVQVTRVSAPPSTAAQPPYDKKTLPVFVLRRQGEAWSNPFVAVFEADTGASAVQSVERLMQDGRFKGVRVESKVDGRELVQFIISQEAGETYAHDKLPLKFDGRFGVLTLSKDGKVVDAYIGEGRALRYGKFTLEAAPNKTSAYWSSKE